MQGKEKISSGGIPRCGMTREVEAGVGSVAPARAGDTGAVVGTGSLG
jgi:hypothetical protein